MYYLFRVFFCSPIRRVSAIVVNVQVLIVFLSFRCKSCNHMVTTEDVEDWMYHQLEDTSHLLHGVIHANGYGHLLRVNGREGGSRVLSGCHIMNFWDRLCKVLGVRLAYGTLYSLILGVYLLYGSTYTETAIVLCTVLILMICLF